MQQPLLYRPVRQLAFLQYRFDLFHWPAFTKRQNPHSVSICRAAQSMRANLVIDTYDLQISLRIPVEGEIKVAGENLPLRPIVKLDDVALGVRSDFHRPGALVLASRDLRRVSPATTSLSASVWPEAIKPNMHSLSVFRACSTSA